MASRSAAELAGKFHHAATLIPKANRSAVEESALWAKEAMLRGGVAAGLRRGGALPRASGAKWGARYDIKGTRNPTALIRYVGPVHWAFSGTEDHFIVASRYGNFRSSKRKGGRSRSASAISLEREVGANAAFGGSNRGRFAGLAAKQAQADAKRAKGGRSVRARKQALRTPQGLRAYAFVRGAKGRNTWPQTKKSIEDRTPAVFVRMHRHSLISAGFGR